VYLTVVNSVSVEIDFESFVYFYLRIKIIAYNMNKVLSNFMFTLNKGVDVFNSSLKKSVLCLNAKLVIQPINKHKVKNLVSLYYIN
jgi:hypothetical protein